MVLEIRWWNNSTLYNKYKTDEGNRGELVIFHTYARLVATKNKIVLHVSMLPRQVRRMIDNILNGEAAAGDMSVLTMAYTTKEMRSVAKGYDYVAFILSDIPAGIFYDCIHYAIVPGEIKTKPSAKALQSTSNAFTHKWKPRNAWGSVAPHVEILVPELSRDDHSMTDFPDELFQKIQPNLTSQDMRDFEEHTNAKVTPVPFVFRSPDEVLADDPTMIKGAGTASI